MRIEFEKEDWEYAVSVSGKLCQELEETLLKARSVLVELSEDPDMLLIPESYRAIENLNDAVGKLYSIRESTEHLHRVLIPVPGTFDSIEREFQTRIYENGRIWTQTGRKLESVFFRKSDSNETFLGEEDL